MRARISGWFGVPICGDEAGSATLSGFPSVPPARMAVTGRENDMRSERGYSFSPALLAQLVEHLHGKEGVDGSSPSEGLSWNHEAAAKGGFSVAIKDTADHLLCKEGVNDRRMPQSQRELA